MSLCLLLAALLGASPAPQDIPGPGDGWTLVDAVVAQVDDRIVVWSDVDQRWLQVAGRRPAPPPEAILRQLLDEHLRAQAGRELGVPEEGVRRLVSNHIEGLVKREGALALGGALREMGDDPLNQEQVLAAQLYGIFWLTWVTGMEGPSADRPRAERFVRPGELLQFYLANLPSLSPMDVRLEVLDISAAAAGSLDYALEDVEVYAARVRAGEAFAELARRHSATFRDNRGELGPAPLTSLDPYTAQFAFNAEEGELSEPLPLTTPRGTLEGFRLARLLERTIRGPAPSFEDADQQRDLRERYLGIRDERVLSQALRDRRSRSYLWIHPDLEEPR